MTLAEVLAAKAAQQNTNDPQVSYEGNPVMITKASLQMVYVMVNGGPVKVTPEQLSPL